MLLSLDRCACENCSARIYNAKDGIRAAYVYSAPMSIPTT